MVLYTDLFCSRFLALVWFGLVWLVGFFGLVFLIVVLFFVCCCLFVVFVLYCCFLLLFFIIIVVVLGVLAS